ncbi:MAG TPA: cytochrome c biogenesis protein CcsA [bacterium]|nr:cytochrome c biogenesis protein CcsA [bacterium]
MMRERASWSSDVVLGWVCFGAMLLALYGAFVYAQREVVMGDVQRIFYVHLPLAWVGFVAFGHAAWAGLRYLQTGRREWDVASASAAEIGVLFATLVIITGSLWARPVWGTWWTWDPQLVTYLILWLIYAGYLVLRAAAGDDSRQARFAAVFAIVGFVDVPLVWLSARYLRALSPVIFTTHSIGLAPSMAWALLAGLVAWSLLYVVLVRARIRLGVLEARVQALTDGSA